MGAEVFPYGPSAELRLVLMSNVGEMGLQRPIDTVQKQFSLGLL